MKRKLILAGALVATLIVSVAIKPSSYVEHDQMKRWEMGLPHDFRLGREPEPKLGCDGCSDTDEVES